MEIYEKNNIVGGECTGWDRKGYHIDNCLHWMMGTNEGTDLYDIWKTVGAIGDNVKIGAGCLIFDSNFHSTDWRIRSDRSIDTNSTINAPVRIGNHAFIGARCIVTKGVT